MANLSQINSEDHTQTAAAYEGLRKAMEAQKQELIDASILQPHTGPREALRFLGHTMPASLLGTLVFPGVGTLGGFILANRYYGKKLRNEDLQLVQKAIDDNKLKFVDGKLELVN